MNVSVSTYYYGIELYRSSNNTVTGTISNCYKGGFYLYLADNNTITDVLVSGCKYYGIYIAG